MKKIIPIAAALMLSACCTSYSDMATFEKNGETLQCGSCMSAHAAFAGPIGEAMANSSARQCFRDAFDAGYTPTSYTKSHGIAQTTRTLTGEQADAKIQEIIGR